MIRETEKPLEMVSAVRSALAKLRAARLAEIDALAEIVASFAGAETPSRKSTVLDAEPAAILASPLPEELCYLSISQLAARIPYEEKTIRNLMSARVFVEGKHFFKRRGRVMFSWPAVKDWIEGETAPECPAVPLVRNRHGRSIERR